MKYVLLHDVDVTSGTGNASVLAYGIVNAGVVDDDVKQQLESFSSNDLPFIQILER